MGIQQAQEILIWFTFLVDLRLRWYANIVWLRWANQTAAAMGTGNVRLQLHPPPSIPSVDAGRRRNQQTL
jgi:hypothetical protein